MELLQLLYGTNIIRIEDEVKKIAKSYVGDLDEFNFTRLNYKEISTETIIEEAQTLPFLSDRKVIVIEDAILFTGQKETGSLKHNLDPLIDYVSNKMDDTLLIFIVYSEKLDKRKKITKVINQKGKVIEINDMTESELTAYVHSVLDKEDISIEHQALNLLLERTAYKYELLYNELSKLILYVDDEIKLTDVQNLVTISLEENVFLLTDYILKNEKTKAVKLADDLILQKEEPIKLLHLIIGQFRLFYQVKILSQQGYQEDNMAKTLKVHPYRVKLAHRYVSKVQLDVLLSKMILCRDIDFRFKSSYLDREALFELFILEI